MPEAQWNHEELEGFRAAAQSLKLYRRAELEDESTQKSLIKDLYVDPLPAEHIFRTALKPNTTFLIGRKGTGKSTIFQRVQYELRQMSGFASAYVDIKTVFESSSTDPELIASLGPDVLSADQIRKLQLYRAFIRAVITAIKEEIKKKLKESTWEWIKEALNRVGIKHLYVFVDDFSELPEDAMIVVVDALLAPLNNWSEELIKFKIAAYPHRVYYGQIDKTKIDEIYLDLYRLYGTTDVTAMEQKAIDFTRRLVNGRLKYFADTELHHFIESDEDAIWQLLFFASMGNPRTLGHILYYLHESHLIYSNRAGARAIRDAASRYYDEKVSLTSE